MVLCPFVFLTTRSDSPTLKLQPTEVASTHWTPLRALLSESLRTERYVDVSSRFARQGGLLARLAVWSLLGWMQFSAIQLLPSETQQCTSALGFFPDDQTQHVSFLQRINSMLFNKRVPLGDTSHSLQLWGLTLGIMADFLDMLPPHTAVQLWKYPTFTAPDLRLIVSVLTYHLRKHNTLKVKLGARSSPNDTATDSETAALPVTPDATAHDHNEVGIGGLGVGRYYGLADHGTSYAVGIMLQGYYQRLRVAIYVCLALRVAIGSGAAITAWRYWFRRLK